MTVFIAGGSGTLGLPLAAELVRRGHRVAALTRSPEKQSAIRAVGAQPAVADVYDAAALARVIADARPTHVVNLLTALPKAGPTKASHLEATNRIRIEGTRNLIAAAARAGAVRLVSESFMAVYGRDGGDAPLDESTPVAPSRRAHGMGEARKAMLSLERQTLEAAGRSMEGIVLRYGAFYGPDNPSTRVRLEQLLRRRAPVVWHDRSLLSFIHQDDAVSATIAALERGEAGAVYNVADDEPVSASEFTRRLAAAAGAPPPFGVPLWLLKATMPYLADVLTMRLPLSNRRAQAALGWRPQFSTTREGLEDVVRRLGARRRAA